MMIDTTSVTIGNSQHRSRRWVSRPGSALRTAGMVVFTVMAGCAAAGADGTLSGGGGAPESGGVGGVDSGPDSSGASGAAPEDAGGENQAACTPGDTRLCVGPGACQGGQLCTSGTWGTCDCGVADAGGADAQLDAGPTCSCLAYSSDDYCTNAGMPGTYAYGCYDSAGPSSTCAPMPGCTAVPTPQSAAKAQCCPAAICVRALGFDSYCTNPALSAMYACHPKLGTPPPNCQAPPNLKDAFCCAI